MRFEELSKKHQEFLMYCLSDYIKGKIRKGSMDGIIFPTHDEYKEKQQYPALSYQVIKNRPKWTREQS